MASSKKASSHLTDIPDHLLAEIFVRLPATEDLARASACCVSFRRIVTDGSFIRHFRRLHAAPLLGFLEHDDFSPAVPPHPSASGARALARAADFSFSFLPSHHRWTFRDTRDGRVLLDGNPTTCPRQRSPVLPQLVVCDPLHRRYILLPQVPDDLTAPLQNHLAPNAANPECNPFLFPLRDKEEAFPAEDTSAFRVIWMARCKTKLSAFVFSSSTGQWRLAASKAWADLVHGVDRRESDSMAQAPHFFLRRHYAHGCFYWEWSLMRRKKLLVLDTTSSTMEFSMTDLPPGEWSTSRYLAIVDAGEGRLGMFGFRRTTASDLTYIIARNKLGGIPSQWQVEKTVALDSGCKYHIKDETEGFLLLRKTEPCSIQDSLAEYSLKNIKIAENSSLENPLVEYLSMDVKTFKIQRFCVQGTNMYTKLIYTNFPPSFLSSPTI